LKYQELKQISKLFIKWFLVFKIYYFYLRALQIFASAACLNASFLDENDHYNTSNKYPGVDLKQARNLVKVISSADTNIVNVVSRLVRIER
jgi:hypothetical protein